MITLIIFFCAISVIVLIGIIVCGALYHKSHIQSQKLAELENQAISYQNRILEKEQQIHKLQQSLDSLRTNTIISQEMIKENISGKILDQTVLNNFENVSSDINLQNYEEFVSSSILNVCINRKVKRAEAMGISLDITFDGGFIPDFDTLDMTTLYENLLDNAIEACASLEESAKETNKDIPDDNTVTHKNIDNPCIICQCNVMDNHNYHIMVTNKKLQDSHPIDTDFVSTKEDSEHHGNGIRIIKTIVGKYKGIVEFFDRETSFVVDIRLPF